MNVKTSNWLFGIMMIIIIGISFAATSCAQFNQKVKADGGVFVTRNGAWVVEKTSGGVIMDVYILDDAIVKSEQGSDGWLFTDKNGNPVHIGGDMKAIRCNNEKTAVFNQYVEFHADVDLCTYKEKFDAVRGTKDPFPSNMK
jgi:hypothetical protein